MREAALRLLARREHSRRELGLKLAQRGYDAETIEAVVAVLASERLVDDARFAEALVNSRRGRGQGPVRIRAALQEHHIEEATIEQALEAAGGDWLILASAVRKKRFGRPPDDYRERARQARFLQYRGFTGEQVRRVLGEAVDEGGGLEYGND